ncbi:MAG: hypothetical protein ABJL67_12345 [Sulfitobacter sp.]
MDFLVDYHVIEVLLFVAIAFYFAFSKRIADTRRERARQDREKRAYDRSTARTSEYYSTEIDEL